MSICFLKDKELREINEIIHIITSRKKKLNTNRKKAQTTSYLSYLLKVCQNLNDKEEINVKVDIYYDFDPKIIVYDFI